MDAYTVYVSSHVDRQGNSLMTTINAIGFSNVVRWARHNTSKHPWGAFISLRVDKEIGMFGLPSSQYCSTRKATRSEYEARQFIRGLHPVFGTSIWTAMSLR